MNLTVSQSRIYSKKSKSFLLLLENTSTSNCYLLDSSEKYDTMTSMKKADFNTVYVALRVKVSKKVSNYQRKVCERFSLTPRSELHITLAYFGKVSNEDVVTLASQLEGFAIESMNKVSITGLGGAYQPKEGVLEYILEEVSKDYSLFPRVLWWAVLPTNDIVNFRNNIISIATSMGLPTTYLRPMYSPHITIGSAGPNSNSHEWDLWDVHALEKKSSIEDTTFPNLITIDRVHITSATDNPKSIILIKGFS